MPLDRPWFLIMEMKLSRQSGFTVLGTVDARRSIVARQTLAWRHLRHVAQDTGHKKVCWLPPPGRWAMFHEKANVSRRSRSRSQSSHNTPVMKLRFIDLT